ncbi:MAG: class I SAM-dependent methyltransferase [Candidatus Udaeobacter sp.]
MEGQYSGVDILEALESAHNYNDYLTRLICESTESKDLTDFGAGTGTFAKRLRQQGRCVLCIEPDSSQRERLIAAGFKVLPDIDSVPDESLPFVFSLNVFEHIENDRRAIEQIYEKLAPNGALLLYVPAFHCLWSSLDDKVGHYRRYTKRTLRALVQPKFSIEKLQYVDFLGFIAAMTFRFLRSDARSLTAKSIASYDTWIFPLSRVFDVLFHRFLGKNVFVVCKKIAVEP